MQSNTETVFADLTRSMREGHTAVHLEKNPVAKALGTYGQAALQHIVGQYSIFPRHIVGFLYAARDTARGEGWQAVNEELTRNIGEELGTETDGVSHYDMLIRGIADAVDTTLYGTFATLAPSPATSAFLSRVAEAVKSRDVAYAIGATYALESSAVPELIIVKDVLAAFLQKAAGRTIEGTLKVFFDMHLGTWEPGHEQGLHSTVPTYLRAQDLDTFRAGFEEVMTAMDGWWIGLNEEARELV